MTANTEHPDATAMERASQWITDCVQDTDGLNSLATEWSLLFDRTRCETVFLSFEWMSGVHSHWGRRHQLFVITVRERNGRLVALAPFCIGRPLVAAGLRAVRFLSAPSLAADHMTLLVEPEYQEQALAEIAKFMIANRTRWDYIELSDADAESPPLLELQRQLSSRGMRVSNEKRYACPYAILPSDFEQYLATIGPSVRYNFRRRLRNLKREHRVEFLAIDHGPELASGFDTMINLHSLRFQQRGDSSAFTTAKALAFHRSVLHRLAERGWVRLFLLCAGNAVVAALYGFSIGRGFKFYQCGMNPAWSNFSVGLVLMGCTIEAAIQSGHQQYDFLRGDERYKFHWAKHQRETIVLRCYDSRLRSRLAARAIALRTRLGRLWSAWNRARIRGFKPAKSKDQCA